MERLPESLERLVLMRSVARRGRVVDLGVVRTRLGRLKSLDVHTGLDVPDLALLRQLCAADDVTLTYDPQCPTSSLPGACDSPVWLRARGPDAPVERRRRGHYAWAWSHEAVARLARTAFARIKDDALVDGPDLDPDRLSPAELNWFLGPLEFREGADWRAPLPPLVPVGAQSSGAARGRWGTEAEWRRFYGEVRVGYVERGGRGVPLIDEAGFKGLLLWWLETGEFAAWRVSPSPMPASCDGDEREDEG